MGKKGKRMKKLIQSGLLLAFLFCTAAWGADEKEITVTLTVPDTAWTLAIEAVYHVENELWVIARVSRDPDLMGAQVITTVQASLRLAAPDLPVKYFVIGKTWNWENTEPYTFIKDLKQLERKLQSGTLLYKSANENIRPAE